MQEHDSELSTAKMYQVVIMIQQLNHPSKCMRLIQCYTKSQRVALTQDSVSLCMY